MDIRIMGTLEEIKKAVNKLNETWTFFYDESPRLRKGTPGIDPRENPDYVADLFHVMTREDYLKEMQAKGYKKTT